MGQLPRVHRLTTSLKTGRHNQPVARLACGFAVSVTTAWRYVREAVDLLAAHAQDLNAAIRRIGRLAYAILDGTLIPIDRVAGSSAAWSGLARS